MSDKKLKYVDLVLEPVESYRIKAEDVVRLSISNIYRDLHYDNIYHLMSNYVGCDEASIDIEMAALQKIETTQYDDNGNVLTLDRRLNWWKDLVALDLIYDDDSDDYIYVPWGENDEAPDDNGYMSTALSEDYSDAHNQIFSMTFSPRYKGKKMTDTFDIDLTDHDDADDEENKKQ